MKPDRVALVSGMVAMLFVSPFALVYIYAITITTTKTTNNGLHGNYTGIYWENANAPTSSSPITVDTSTAYPSTSGSFSLAAATTMYLWSPSSATTYSIPAGSIDVQLFVRIATPPALDGKGIGSCTACTGSTFTIGSVTTTRANDIIMLHVSTYKSGSSITVSSVTDSGGAVTWQTSARTSLVACTGTQETTTIEWYGVAASAITSAITITVHLSAIPTDAYGTEFAVSGTNTASPFDPSNTHPTNTACSGTKTAPSVAALTTTGYADLLFAFYTGYTSTTETAGLIAGTTATLINTPTSGAGYSRADEYITVTTTEGSQSCAFGGTTTYWGVICDALVTANQIVTYNLYTITSGGVVQSTLVSGATVTLANTATSVFTSAANPAGSLPAGGYLQMTVVSPATAAFTINWGTGSTTHFAINLRSSSI